MHPANLRRPRASALLGQAIAFVALIVVLGAGCASAFMKGGSLVDDDYEPDEVVIEYRAEGVVPPGTTYLLVRHEGELAIFERGSDGSGALMEVHWEDAAGDHFAGWVATGPAYEFVVPLDRTQPASRYVYLAGSYEVEEVDGEDRPIPAQKVDPVAQLFAVNAAAAGAPPPVAAAPVAAAPAAGPTPPPHCAPVEAASVAGISPPTEAWTIIKNRTVCITHKDGSVIQGEVVGVDDKSVTVIKAGGEVGVVPKADAAQLRIVDPAATEPAG